jgi:hypothetical protein
MDVRFVPQSVFVVLEETKQPEVVLGKTREVKRYLSFYQKWFTSMNGCTLCSAERICRIRRN